MPYTLWSQDIFSKGELSPFMYARATVNEYQNGLKTAQNVLTYPTGAAGKRFGTLYQSTITGVTSSLQINFSTFQYLNEAVYQLVFIPGFVIIYLEGIEIARPVTGLDASTLPTLSTTTLGTLFRVAGLNFHPKDLVRSGSAPTTVTVAGSNLYTTTGFTTSPAVYPVRFSAAGGTIMVTTPQIVPNVTYFAAAISSTQAALFTNSFDAKQFLINHTYTKNQIAITSLGSGTTSQTLLNTWTFSDCYFKNVPFYDFNGAVTSYNSLTFKPSATFGNAVVITISGPYAPITSPDYVGGAFFGAGGAGRILNVSSTTTFTLTMVTPFISTDPIQGSEALLAEKAWSDNRGWPSVCSSYQNRALFANSTSLPNGFWTSVINDYTNYGNLTSDDDDAISWYPTSDNMNFIKFIVPYRSITVHTNTGIYSSPLSDTTAITPSNFSLILQDSTPASVIQPQAVDNQIVVLSGNDAHQMIWDGINNAYTSNVVSVINEQVIRDPVDETAFIKLDRAGSRFLFITNANGTMATYQTLISENVSGFTIQFLEQSYGNASFLQSGSSSDGRCWFICQRQIAQAVTGINITGFTAASGTTPSNLRAVGSAFSTTTPTAIMFTTTGTLPASTPAINTTNYFWAIGVDSDHFEVYLTQEDAIAAANAVSFTSAGTNSKVVPWPLTTIFTLEELTENVFLDCAVQYSGSVTTTVTTGPLFNAQDVKMVGDGFGFESAAEVNTNNQITFVAHGVDIFVGNAFIGFPINTVMEPMPLSISSGNSAKETTLTKPKHIRSVRFMFNNTIGGTINGVPIALLPFDQADIGNPPQPARGIFEMSIFSGWDDFNNPVYTIEHNDPFDIQLLGVFSSVEI